MLQLPLSLARALWAAHSTPVKISCHSKTQVWTHTVFPVLHGSSSIDQWIKAKAVAVYSSSIVTEFVKQQNISRYMHPVAEPIKTS